ncbi:AAA family ATPase [Alphaproteobacteria bacterium]|nr:AAA family ATPase [Alphaproteobacteria bacterium]
MDQNISMPILTAAELMKLEFPPPQWLVEGLLPEGLTVLSGAPKIGKSWLSLQIALSITTASPLFGRAPASEKSVLLLALEDNERRLQERISKCRLTASEKFCLATKWEDGISGLKLFLLDNPTIKLCIVDTLAVFLPSQDTRGRNAYDADVARMRELHNLGRDTGTSLLMIHHDKQGEDSDWASKMNGSSGVIGTADTLIRLSVQKRGSRQAKLQVTGRDVEDLELNLKLDDTTMSWQIDKGQDDRQLTALQNDVLQLVPFTPASIRSREIADKLAKEQSQISEILKKLTDRGYVFSPTYSEYSKSPY